MYSTFDPITTENKMKLNKLAGLRLHLIFLLKICIFTVTEFKNVTDHHSCENDYFCPRSFNSKSSGVVESPPSPM